MKWTVYISAILLLCNIQSVIVGKELDRMYGVDMQDNKANALKADYGFRGIFIIFIIIKNHPFRNI